MSDVGRGDCGHAGERCTYLEDQRVSGTACGMQPVIAQRQPYPPRLPLASVPMACLRIPPCAVKGYIGCTRAFKTLRTQPHE